jgi:hypothetical protein
MLLPALAALALAAPASSAPAKAPRAMAVRPGTTVAVTKLQLAPGADVVCRSRGRTLTVAAPTGRQTGSGAVWPGGGHLNFHLTVDVTPRGGYLVVCGPGGIHW